MDLPTRRSANHSQCPWGSRSLRFSTKFIKARFPLPSPLITNSQNVNFLTHESTHDVKRLGRITKTINGGHTSFINEKEAVTLAPGFPLTIRKFERTLEEAKTDLLEINSRNFVIPVPFR